MQRGSRQSGRSVSQRHFLRKAATGVGMAVAASTSTAVSAQPEEQLARSQSLYRLHVAYRLPSEFLPPHKQPPRRYVGVARAHSRGAWSVVLRVKGANFPKPS